MKKKILIIVTVVLLIFNLIGCNKGNNSGEKDAESKPVSTEGKKDKIYGIGEEVVVKDSSGKDMYSLKINGAKVADDFKYKDVLPATNQKQIIEIDYTYKNIAKADELKLYIDGSDLQVIDSTGLMGQSTDIFPKQKPQRAPIGASCTVQAYFGLQNKSDKVKIVFSSESYKTTITFEVSLDQIGNATPSKDKEEKIYKIGDTIEVGGKYTLTINKAFLTPERNPFSEMKVEKVAVIEFTYKNINSDEDIFIGDLHFKVYDEEGNALETYPAGANKMSQQISKGKQCTAEMSFGYNKGNKLELQFYDNMFNNKSDATFIVEVK